MDYRSDAQARLDERGTVVEKRRALTDSITGEPTAEQRTQLDRMDQSINSLYDEALSIVDEGEREAKANELRSRAGALARGGVPTNQPPAGTRTLNDEIRALTLPGQVVNIVPDRVVDAGNAGEVRSEYRVATTGSATNAGNTVPTTFVAKVLEAALPEIGVWQAGPTIFTTTAGNPMQFPKLTGRPSTAPVAENSPYSKSDATFGTFTLGAHKYGVIIQVSKEMAQDSLIDIAGYVAGQAGTMLGREIAGDLINNSTSSTGPIGFLTQTTLGATAASATAISGDDLLKIFYSVIKPYRISGKWMMNDATVGGLRGIKDSYGQYLWQPGLVLGEPDVLLSKPVVSDTNMPTVAASAKSIAFGDFSKYFVRQVNGLSIELSLEYGWDSDLLSYKVSWRGDGALSDTTGAIKHLAQAAS